VLAGVYTAEAVRLLATVMRDTTAPLMARVLAADKLLDRACGRPGQAPGRRERDRADVLQPSSKSCIRMGSLRFLKGVSGK
jgi:hypothetical protein